VERRGRGSGGGGGADRERLEGEEENSAVRETARKGVSECLNKQVNNDNA